MRVQMLVHGCGGPPADFRVAGVFVVPQLVTGRFIELRQQVESDIRRLIVEGIGAGYVMAERAQRGLPREWLGTAGLGSSSVLAGFSPLAVFSVLAGCGGGAGLSLSGGGNNSSSFAWKPSPIWSVNTASASFGSVTIWKTWSEMRRFARNWSSPLAILTRYTVCTLARSAAHSIAPEQQKRRTSRFIEPMISRRAASGKRRTHV